MKQILLIDPEKTTLDLSKKFLENHGFEVRACANASDAIDVLLSPKFDLIITEIDINGLDGFDLCLILNRYHIKVPVLFLSNRDDETTRQEADNAGVSSFISKQHEYSQLPGRVRQILQEVVQMAS